MPKRHHYVPVTYLRNFTDQRGRVYVYRKDDPEKPLPLRPQEAGLERYYYSQFADDGTRDDDQLEAAFNLFENLWPSIVEGLSSRQAEFRNSDYLIAFMAMSRVRVPAFRDAIELQLARSVGNHAKLLYKAGELAPLPEGHEDLLEKLLVSIDPQKSIEAMAHLARPIGMLLAHLEMEAVHNQTGIPFITSDNPLIYFDPTVPESRMLPYTVLPQGPVEALFPVTPNLLVRAHSRFSGHGVQHRDTDNARWVRRVNRLTAKFAYKAVFASTAEVATLVRTHASKSPVLEFHEEDVASGGILAFSQFVFGKRPIKTPWRRPSKLGD